MKTTTKLLLLPVVTASPFSSQDAEMKKILIMTTAGMTTPL